VPLTRIDAWPQALAAYEKAESHREFVWGHRDCVLVGLRIAEIILRISCTAGISGTYSTARGAAKMMLKLYGAKCLEDACVSFAATWGDIEISPALAQRGDLVLADMLIPGGASAPSLGFVGVSGRDGRFAAPVGLSKSPLTLCRRAWRVG